MRIDENPITARNQTFLDIKLPISQLSFTPQSLASVVYQAARIARREFKSSEYTAHKKEDGSFVTSVDMAVHHYLSDKLPTIYNALVVSEEDIPDFSKRKTENAIWLVDPIDNTAGIIEGSLENSSINIALVVDGVPKIGIIHYFKDNCGFMSIQDQGAFIVTDTALVPFVPPEVSRPFRYASYKPSLTLMDDATKIIHTENSVEDGQLVYLNRLPKRLKAVMQGIADVYIEPRPIPEWDLVAAISFVKCLGGTCIEIASGKPVSFNSESLLVKPFILARAGVNIENINSTISSHQV